MDSLNLVSLKSLQIQLRQGVIALKEDTDAHILQIIILNPENNLLLILQRRRRGSGVLRGLSEAA